MKLSSNQSTVRIKNIFFLSRNQSFNNSTIKLEKSQFASPQENEILELLKDSEHSDSQKSHISQPNSLLNQPRPYITPSTSNKKTLNLSSESDDEVDSFTVEEDYITISDEKKYKGEVKNGIPNGKGKEV